MIELICKMDLPLYAGGKGEYLIRFEFPKPWWKPQFIHNRQVSKLIEQIKEEMQNEV